MNRGQAPSEGQGQNVDDVHRWVRELQDGTDVEGNSRRVFGRYYDWVRGFFRRRGFPATVAEDLAQETFLQAFREIAAFRGESSFDGWLFAVAANLSRNELRRRATIKRAANTVALDDGEGDSPGPASRIRSPESSPDRTVYEKQRRDALRRAIDDLPPQMRRCVLLRLDRDMKYREIATLMKMNLETVKAHLFQARRRLREMLGDELGEWGD